MFLDVNVVIKKMERSHKVFYKQPFDLDNKIHNFIISCTVLLAFCVKNHMSIEKKKATEEAEALAISQSMLKCEEEEEPMDKLNGIPPTQLSPRLGIHSNVIVGYVFYQTNFNIVNDLTELLSLATE